MLALEVPEEHSYIGMVRRTARTLLEHHQAVAQDIDDVETVLGEICSNVTRHARSAGGCYRVTLEHHQDRVVLVVVDRGNGFDPAGLPPVGQSRLDADGTPRYGGFGLHLVRSLTDCVAVEPADPHGTTVRAEKRLTRVPPLLV